MLANRRIAVVDDDEGSCSSMVALLRSFGCRAQAFQSAEAYLADTTANWECIVSDINMPGTDGYQFLSALRRRSGASPVILMTAYLVPGARSRAREAGAVDFLEKPVDDAILLSCLERIFGEASDAGPDVAAERR